MKSSNWDALRGVSACFLFVYACGAWLFACAAGARDSTVVPVGEIVRIVGCLIAWYVGHRALCCFCEQISPTRVRAGIEKTKGE